MSTIDVANLQDVNQYSTILQKQNIINNVYYLDVSNTSGYVFEMAVFDTSGTLQIDPTFDTTIQQDVGLEDVSAIAMLDVPLSNFNSIFVFRFKSKIRYGCFCSIIIISVGPTSNFFDYYSLSIISVRSQG